MKDKWKNKEPESIICDGMKYGGDEKWRNENYTSEIIEGTNTDN